ncbi:hypothetical protein SRHO_G00321880 [Serrasalmus rhombeus]
MSSIGQAVAHSSREGYGGSNTHFHSTYPIYSFPSWSRGPSSSAVVQLSSSPELELSEGSQLQNQALQTELLLLRQRHSEPLCLQALYEQEVRELHATVDQTCSERQAAQEQVIS